jgi:hypothetical protein
LNFTPLQGWGFAAALGKYDNFEFLILPHRKGGVSLLRSVEENKFFILTHLNAALNFVI